jgi:hypothetical protein
MATLTIQLPGFPPVSHVLSEETITIGRMRGNAIVLDDSSVSLFHAKITRKNGEYFLKDLNSTNGTAVNGQFVNEARLNDLDRVKFADIAGQFLAETSPAVASKPVIPAAEPVAQPEPPAATTFIAKPPPAPVAAPVEPPPKPPVVLPGVAIVSATRPAAPPAAPLPRPPAQPDELRRLKVGPRILPLVAGAVALIGIGIIGWTFFHSGGKPADGSAGAVLPSATAVPPKRNDSAVAPVQPEPVAKNPPAKPAAPVPVTEGGPAASISQWVKELGNPDPLIRRQAARNLHSSGADARGAIPALRTALQDSDAEVQMWSALALVNNKSYDKAAIPILVRTLQNENPVLRQVACLSLALIPYEGAEKESVVPALVETAGKDADEDVRKAAGSALKVIAPESTAN